MRTVLLVIPVAAAAVVLAGCGSSSKSAAPAPPTSPLASGTATVTDTVVPPTTTATASTTVVTGPAACATANLSVTLGAADGAAGSSYYPLHLTNRGSAACTITGFPGVSFAQTRPNGAQAQIGTGATRSGATGATVTLAPGAEATALLQVADYHNFSPDQCQAVQVDYFQVYPPANKVAAYVKLPSSTLACSKDLTSTGSSELMIQAVRAGTTGM